MAMEKHFIQEGIIRSEIETFLRHELEGAGYSGINIQKTPLATRVVLYVEKPPLVIGKKGRRINKLTKFLKEKYGIDNPAIDVQAVENPNLDANIVARRIAQSLEKGMNRRRVVYKAVRSAMGSGARGVEIILAGKIIGKGGRAKQEKYLQGYMRKVGDSAKLVRQGSTQAYLKAGVIGVTVKIVPPDIVFPDQIEVIPKAKPVEAVEESKIAEKAVEKAAEKPMEKLAEKLAEKPMEKLAEKPMEKLAEKPMEKLAEKPVEKLPVAMAPIVAEEKEETIGEEDESKTEEAKTAKKAKEKKTPKKIETDEDIEEIAVEITEKLEEL